LVLDFSPFIGPPPRRRETRQHVLLRPWHGRQLVLVRPLQRPYAQPLILRRPCSVMCRIKGVRLGLLIQGATVVLTCVFLGRYDTQRTAVLRECYGKELAQRGHGVDRGPNLDEIPAAELQRVRFPRLSTSFLMMLFSVYFFPFYNL
jgi:hypothetical protein